MRISVSGFGGANLALEPRLLPESVGVVSLNQKPGRGDLRPWRVPQPVATVPAGQRTIYRMGRDVPGRANYWLSLAGEGHFIRGFDPEDPAERTYFTGSGTPKWTDNLTGLASAPYPSAARELAVPRPEAAPALALTASSGSGDAETIFYTYTFVNELGWESAPAPTASLVKRPADTVTVTGFSGVPSGHYGVTLLRLYRTQAGTTGDVEFFMHSQVPIGTASIVDSGQALAADVLETTGWLPPPATGRHLTALWGHMAALIDGKTVRLCEPGALYAWPPQNELIFADTPVALAVWRQNLLVLTTGVPSVVIGADPESMDDEPLPINQRCMAAASVVAFKHGVAYAGNEGLVYIGDGVAANVTEGLILQEDWQALNPASMVGGQFGRFYIGSYDRGGGRKGFVIDPRNPTGLWFLDTGFTACHYDESQNLLFVLNGTQVQEWDAGVALMAATFRSKLFHLPRPVNLGYGQIVASSWPVTFRAWADGVLKTTRTVTSGRPFTLPAGFLASEWQFDLQTAGAVQGLVVAETIDELKQS
jgi:hypothetical protein